MGYSRIAACLGAMGISGSAVAQSTGLLTYSPAPFVAVPVPISSLLLLPLSVGIVLAAFLALRKKRGSEVLGIFALTLGAGLFVFSGFQIQQATAQAAIELSNPQGGVVDVPQSAALYTNTSGVPLQIESIEPPPLCSSLVPADECVPALTLRRGESCSTQYDCPEPQTITFTSTPPADAIVNGAPYVVTATASSGLPVSFTTASAACSVAGSTVTFDAEGACVIDADQAGNADFLPAPRVQQNFLIAPPFITFVPSDPICSFGSPPNGCNAQPLSEFNISPACDAAGWMVNVDWDQDADGSIDQANVTTQFSPVGNTYNIQGAYPFGTHMFKVRAEDACGTVLTADIPFEVIDCKAPSPICINGLTVNLIDGSGAVFATDFIASPATDCSEPVEFSINPAGEMPDRSELALAFSCDDLGIQFIEIQGWDAVDNRDFCEVAVLVQDTVPSSCVP